MSPVVARRLSEEVLEEKGDKESKSPLLLGEPVTEGYSCLQVFADLFDPVIKLRHNGYDPRVMKHPTDLDASKVGSSPTSPLPLPLPLHDAVLPKSAGRGTLRASTLVRCPERST